MKSNANDPLLNAILGRASYSKEIIKYSGYGSILEARRIYSDRSGVERRRHTLAAVLVQNLRDRDAAFEFVVNVAKRLSPGAATSILEDGIEVLRVCVGVDGRTTVMKSPKERAAS